MRQVAMLRMRLGDREGGLDALRAHLAASPHQVDLVIWYARQLEPDPRTLVLALVPPGELDLDAADALLTALLRNAASRERSDLAAAAWEALSPAARSRRDVAGAYVDALIQVGDAAQAARVWSWHGGPDAVGARFTDPGFETPPAQSGLGWRVRATRSSTWALDPQVRRQGTSSLRISFDGGENTSYADALQVLPVEGGVRYRISGYWRGADLSSRLGPYLEVVSRGPGEPLRAHTEARIGSWDWTGFALDFEVPRTTRFVEFRVRRDRDARFDVGLAGSLWLDDLRLERLEAS
jgi:hypothetical protein